ncbi:MAG: hypothetical protein GX956_06835 [Firmicutes bacterium]|nr:hypothetical protein [Bacillota bacterium]
MWVNETRTLWVDRNRDTWQLPVLSSDGVYCGNVVAQIVNPKQCLVCYFVVFSHLEERQFLIPSDTIEEIDAALYCTCRFHALQKLPNYVQELNTKLEREIQLALREAP